MRAVPSGPADVAELVPTPACHVVTPLCFLYYILTSCALSEMEGILEERQLKRVAFSFVFGKHAQGTVSFFASIALGIGDHQNQGIV